MIFECGPQGADKQVCEYLAHQLLPDIEISSVTLDNKPNLIAGCGNAATQLLREGCVSVVIVWDLYPPWREKGQRPCRKQDRQVIMESLARAGVTSPNVYLVCITEELEAWLIADGRAIAKVLSRPEHPVKVPDVKKPEQRKNPKKHLNKIFKEKSGRPYTDLIHAKMIVEALPDLNKLKRCPSFVRFALKAMGKEL